MNSTTLNVAANTNAAAADNSPRVTETPNNKNVLGIMNSTSTNLDSIKEEIQIPNEKSEEQDILESVTERNDNGPENDNEDDNKSVPLSNEERDAIRKENANKRIYSV